MENESGEFFLWILQHLGPHVKINTQNFYFFFYMDMKFELPP